MAENRLMLPALTLGFRLIMGMSQPHRPYDRPCFPETAPPIEPNASPLSLALIHR